MKNVSHLSLKINRKNNDTIEFKEDYKNKIKMKGIFDIYIKNFEQVFDKRNLKSKAKNVSYDVFQFFEPSENSVD